MIREILDREDVLLIVKGALLLLLFAAMLWIAAASIALAVAVFESVRSVT